MSRGSKDGKPTVAPAPTASFGLANPPAMARAQGRPHMVRQLEAVDQRVANVKSRMRQHCERFQETWVAREAVRLWKERAELALKHKAPAQAAVRILSPDDLLSLARRNVRARIGQRLSTINRIGERMRNTVTRTLKPASPVRAPDVQRSFAKARDRRRRME